MDSSNIDALVQQLSTGFEALQEEYQKLYGRHQSLEKKLANAREQYNTLAKLYSAGSKPTPPLSLSSQKSDPTPLSSVLEVLPSSTDESAQANARKVEAATVAALRLKQALPISTIYSQNGVRIWSGPSADKPDVCSSTMPSISESPLEQDFTIEGKPSRLGCPFASMNRKKLSSHAASVLSRYNHSGSVGAASTPLSTASHINGKESISRRSSRRESFADPIKAEICGLSDHNGTVPNVDVHVPDPANANTSEVPVCPIRFLDQHSPEEVATYFERHKHELPRSHEICVKRYQSNEEQIRELDAKYGNLVSMIQGLGQKHKTMLPPEIEEEGAEDAASDEKVRQWASSVSLQAPAGDDAMATVEALPEERQSHFERPLRDIRVGESPSRPWGISVPTQYLEKTVSESSSKPAQVAQATIEASRTPQQQRELMPEQAAAHPQGKCPFGHGSGPKPPGHDGPQPDVQPPRAAPEPQPVPKCEAAPKHESEAAPVSQAHVISPDSSARMVFTGPVFIGYGPEEAARFLRESGLLQRLA